MYLIEIEYNFLAQNRSMLILEEVKSNDIYTKLLMKYRGK